MPGRNGKKVVMSRSALAERGCSSRITWRHSYAESKILIVSGKILIKINRNIIVIRYGLINLPVIKG